MNDMMTVPGRSGQQLKLFHLENPLSTRLGTAFFRSLPSGPGVYFFYDALERLLYIGQSGNLRARLGSYRHVTPEKNPKRTLRLVARTMKIQWQPCETAAEAVALESTLLRQHRPLFNRAGVWEGEPWWLQMKVAAQAQGNGLLTLELSREEGGLGPFPAAFHTMLGTLARCIFRASRPAAGLAEYPWGIMGPRVPLSLKLALPDAQHGQDCVQAFIEGQVEPLVAEIEALPPENAGLMLDYWTEEVKLLRRYGAKLAKRAATLAAETGPALPPGARPSPTNRLQARGMTGEITFHGPGFDGPTGALPLAIVASIQAQPSHDDEGVTVP